MSNNKPSIFNTPNDGDFKIREAADYNDSTPPANGQVLAWNGQQFAPTDPSAGIGENAVTSVAGKTGDVTLGTGDITGLNAALAASGRVIPGYAGGRLTAHATQAVPTGDVTGATSLRYLPIESNLIALRNGGTLVWAEFSEAALNTLSFANPAVPHDIFGVFSGGGLTLDDPLPWSSATARATELVAQLGAWWLSGATHKLYLGTVQPTGSGTVEDSQTGRFVWNHRNRRWRSLLARFGTGNTFWDYSLNAWTSANGDDTLRVRWVSGEPTLVEAGGLLFAQASSGVISGAVGLGLDVTNANSANLYGMQATSTGWTAVWATFRGMVSAGAHFLQLAHRGENVNTLNWAGTHNPGLDLGWRGGVEGTVMA